MDMYQAASGMIYPICDEQTAPPPGIDPGQGKGYALRGAAEKALGASMQQFSATLIDPSEYEDRIREKDKNAKLGTGSSWITTLCDFLGLKVKNQKNSSYCWIHAPVHAMEVWYAIYGGTLKVLSAFYAGAIIQGGANRGGSGVTGVNWLMKNGTCLESMHPPMDFSTRNDSATIANAQLHKIDSALELDPGDHQAIITSVLNNQPVTVGIPAWSHEVLITGLVYDKNLYSWNNGVGYIFDNSWEYTWGNNGRGILSRSYSRFDEAMIITGCTPALAA